MTPFDELHQAWGAIEAHFISSRPLMRLARSELSIAHYIAFLRETYFYTREDPQIQAVATAWFRGSDREMVKPFLKHAVSEVGHDQMALDDMAALGCDVSEIPDGRPLPATAALISFPLYAIQYRSPVSYLGYLFFLEFLPTSKGGDIAAALSRMGVPAAAMSFLAEHRSVDVHHNRMMTLYANHMLRTPADTAEVVYAMEVTGALYANMVEGAFESADRQVAAEPARLRA
jgi:pyrroloquinoline quinone (PQQ) biosynthesis protein C